MIILPGNLLCSHMTSVWVLYEREVRRKEVNTHPQGKEKQWQHNARLFYLWIGMRLTGWSNIRELNCRSLAKLHHAVKTWGSGGITQSFLSSALDGGESSASRPGRFTPGDRARGTLWIGGWMGPRTRLDYVEKRNPELFLVVYLIWVAKRPAFDTTMSRAAHTVVRSYIRF
jgi:hypothetical protein